MPCLQVLRKIQWYALDWLRCRYCATVSIAFQAKRRPRSLLHYIICCQWQNLIQSEQHEHVCSFVMQHEAVSIYMTSWMWKTSVSLCACASCCAFLCFCLTFCSFLLHICPKVFVVLHVGHRVLESKSYYVSGQRSWFKEKQKLVVCNGELNSRAFACRMKSNRCFFLMEYTKGKQSVACFVSLWSHTQDTVRKLTLRP